MTEDKWAVRKASFFAKLIVVLLIFTIPFTALSFPKVTLPGIQTLDASSMVATPYAESGAATIFPLLNSTIWNLNTGGQTGYSFNRSSTSLLLTGSIPVSSAPSSISISASLNVNLTQYPIMYMLVQVSSSVSYGIRFSSQSSAGTSIALWSESDALNHRAGLGRFENVQVNMLQLAGANLGRLVGHITSVNIYVERNASSQPTVFSLQIRKFEFLNFPIVPVSPARSYHALYLDTNTPQMGSSSYLENVNLHGVMNATRGAVFVLYFFRGLTVYGGAFYNFSQTNQGQSYSIDLSRQALKSFSDNLPLRSDSIIIVAAAGSLYNFSIGSVTLNYLLRTAQNSTTVSSRDPVIYYTLFLVLLLASVVLLSVEHLRRSKIARSES